MKSKEWAALNKFNNRCVRIIGGFHWKQRQERHTKDKEIFEKTGMATLRHLWDKELLRTMARWNRKGVKSWGNLALTSFIPQEEAGRGGGSSAADPIVERFIATLERLAGVVEAHSGATYKVYSLGREDGGERILELTKHQVGAALRRGIRISSQGEERCDGEGGCESREVDQLTWRQLFKHKSLERRLLALLELDNDVGCEKVETKRVKAQENDGKGLDASDYRGVKRHIPPGKGYVQESLLLQRGWFEASIPASAFKNGKKGEKVCLGVFETAKEAAQCWDEQAMKSNKYKKKLNFKPASAVGLVRKNDFYVPEKNRKKKRKEGKEGKGQGKEKKRKGS